MNGFTMHKFLRVSLISIGLLSWQSCTKEYKVELPTQSYAGDEVDPDLENIIADTPSIPYDLTNLELSNGQTIQQFLDENPDFKPEFEQAKKSGNGRLSTDVDWSVKTPEQRLLALQGLLFYNADYYSDIVNRDPEWSLRNPKDGSATEPFQPYGLAYVHGGARPPKADPALNRDTPDKKCPDVRLYGTDCSGFVYWVFTRAKFRIQGEISSSAMNQLSYWQKMLQNNAEKLKGISVNYVTGKSRTGKDLYLFSAADPLLKDNSFYKPGDIIFWHTASGNTSHMGIVLKNTVDGTLQIFQSNGIENGTNEEKIIKGCGLKKGDCSSNYLCEGRGVHPKPISGPLAFIPQLGTEKLVSIIRFETDLVGNTGNPRFNLQFTNPDNVDLDLYVKDPNGEVIYYNNKTAYLSQGQLDVDCLCDKCPQGPNENIFWPLNMQSPTGKYEFWINYYGFCRQAGEPSSYTVRVTNDSKPKDPILFTATGALCIKDSDSPHWIYDTSTGKVTPK